MSYRGLANQLLGYESRLRDRDIELKGVRTVIRKPMRENANDFYGDPVSTYQNPETIYLLPQYDKYYQIVDLLGQDVELRLGLEALVKVGQHIPNDSIIHLETRNPYGTMEKRWWRVLSARVKHLESHYSKSIFLVPVRESIEQYLRTVNIQAISRVDLFKLTPTELTIKSPVFDKPDLIKFSGLASDELATESPVLDTPVLT